VPYIYRSFRRAEGFDVDRGSESGLGDITLLGRFNAVTTFEHDMSLAVSFFGGLNFPRGIRIACKKRSTRWRCRGS
jgi:hypothetical protein